MKKIIYTFLVLLPLLSSAQSGTKKTTVIPPKKKATQEELFKQFFELGEADTVELNQKAKLMTQVFEMDSSTRYSKYMPAWANILQKNYEVAINYISTDLLTKYPDFAEGYFLYGMALIYAGKEGSEEQIQKCMELNPKLDQPYFFLASLFESEQNYKVALLYYDQLEKVNPKHKSLYYNRGHVKDELKDLPGSIADYTKAIAQQPKHARAIFNRGRGYIALKEYVKAEADFNSFLTLMPGYSGGYYYRGAAKYYLNKTAEACEDMKKAVSLGDESAQSFVQNYCK